MPRNTPLLRFGGAVLDAAPETKEGWFAPEARHEIARDGGEHGLDAGVDHLRVCRPRMAHVR
jgi:hypothetical protein